MKAGQQPSRKPAKPEHETAGGSRVRFWLSVAGVAGLHVWLLALAAGWSRSCAPAYGNPGGGAGSLASDEVTWVDPSVFSVAPPTDEPDEQTIAEDAPEPTPLPEPARSEVEELIDSEIKLPSPTPAPSAKPTREPSPTPKPSPKAAATPKPPKTKKATPKPSPKASPRAAAKKKSSPSPSAKKKTSPSPAPTKAKAKDAEAKEAFLAAKSGSSSQGGGTGGAEGSGSGAGTGTGGDGGAMGRYHAHIQRSFHQRWVQPTSVFTRQTKFVTTVEIAIQKAGTIASVRMVRSSGNPVVDESVMLAARSVTEIDPLPSAAPRVPYVVTIDFELK